MAAGTERTKQKQRTREAILDGARRLLARGADVTIAAAAAEHDISRATAYRYFSDAQALTLEAGLAPLVPSYEAMVAGTTDLRARLLAICAGMMALTLAHEAAFRQYLGHAVVARDTPGKRGARRRAYLERALEEMPCGLARPERERLVALLCAATGIETLVALVDVARIPRSEVPGLAAAHARMIVDAHLGSRAGAAPG